MMMMTMMMMMMMMMILRIRNKVYGNVDIKDQ